MDDARAIERLTEIRALIDRYAAVYERRWRAGHPLMQRAPGLQDSSMRSLMRSAAK